MSTIEIISYIANAVLLIWAVAERILSAKDKAYIKASIRIWQHQAHGIANAIQKLSWASGRLTMTSFSNTKDVGISLDALHDVATSMADSLYESRFFTDEELKRNIKLDKETEKKEEPASVKKPKSK